MSVFGDYSWRYPALPADGQCSLCGAIVTRSDLTRHPDCCSHCAYCPECEAREAAARAEEAAAC